MKKIANFLLEKKSLTSKYSANFILKIWAFRTQQHIYLDHGLTRHAVKGQNMIIFVPT